MKEPGPEWRGEPEDPVTAIERLIPGRVAEADSAVFSAFVRSYYDTASPDALRLRTPEELLDIALGHWHFARTRAAHETLLRVLPPLPPSDGRAPLMVIETCVDDRPFLVDTITLCIRAAGAAIDWSVHPVLRMQRGASRQIERLGNDGIAAESWIHIECEPLASAQAYAQLEADIHRVLDDLRRAVDDYPETLRRLRSLAAALGTVPPGADADEFAEARSFLEYLDDHHFTFLAYEESRAVRTDDGRLRFDTDRSSGLGLLQPDSRWRDEELIAPRAELDKYAESPRLVVVTKANLRSSIHRNELMDIVSIKRFDAAGAILGTVRFVGLFASEVYIDRPPNIPLIRRKADYVMRRSRLPPNSHSDKNLRDILHQLPRDELFQSSEEELYRLCMGIRALRDRHHLRLFARRDRYGRFFSCLVYLPRDQYSRELRDRVAVLLMDAYGGSSVDRTAEFLRSGLARVHYIVRTPPGTVASISERDLEERLVAATRSWREQLREILLRSGRPDIDALIARFTDAFPLGYQASVAPPEAVDDVLQLARLSPSHPLLVRLFVEAPVGVQAHASPNRLKLYALSNPVTLSDVLPTLENFGFRVLRQEPGEVKPSGGGSLWVQELDVSHPGGELDADLQRAYFEAAFLQVWRGEVENDGLNRLVLGAGLTARQTTVLRAILKYLIQTGISYSSVDMEAVLGGNSAIARMLVRLFETRFDPALAVDARKTEELKLAAELDHALDQVDSLDSDRVLRAFLSVIRAALRTNYFQKPHGSAAAAGKHYVSIKLDPAKIPELPLPRPKFEVWVYAPEVEGIHLRGGKVARGGLRWSDRRTDFRTEILGLMKAQMVKNIVIVPVGAKGGFVIKRGPASGEREAWLANGIECYKTFLRGLLDITDNRDSDAIVPPRDVVRYDEDDPYLVVAADKGTATFSDIANGVSAEYGFWLGDAFASGGSAGYDHKKMGITARGAWESVKRHFREMPWTDEAGVAQYGKDTQNNTFTAIGIGDMSGDVFGNGVLLSRKLKLLAAFDHRHIFIDPDPDPEAGFVERERLFRLPRSSWADYDAKLISAGGGVFPRSVKSIRLSAEARRALAIEGERLTPAELIKAILKAPVDLLWNGGIGTYVKASAQTHVDVGDRANDAVRINGRDLRCKVVGEGGNLGFTQLGRVEYALAGGRINTDAIDNAGGVHTSDREVNIKIALNRMMAEGKLTRETRDPLLAELTSNIARFVLRDNYVQSGAISLLEASSAQRLDDHAELMHLLEHEGLLNRAIEFLPDDEALKERRVRGIGLTRPELAVLMAYSKISLFEAALSSDVPDDPFFVHDLLAYFPVKLVTRYREQLAAHRLRREIVATILSNALVNRMGAGFAQLWAEDHGLTRAEVLKAYATAHLIFDGDRYWDAIEALDNRVPAVTQYRLMTYAIGLMKHVTGWLTSSKYAMQPVQAAVDHLAGPIADVASLLPEVLPSSYRDEWHRIKEQLRGEGVPEELAARLANTRALGSAPDIAALAEESGASIADAAGVYYLAGERFNMLWLYSAINALSTQGKWQALARVNLRDDAFRIHRQVAGRILATPGATPLDRYEAWKGANERRVNLALSRLAQLQTANLREFETLAVAVREVRKLR